MAEIPEDIMKSARKCLNLLGGYARDNATYAQCEADARTIALATLAEREHITSNLFHRNGLMLAVTDAGKHYVEISFPTMEEMHEFHSALVGLSQFKGGEHIQKRKKTPAATKATGGNGRG